MLLNSNIYFGVYCDNCGKYENYDISLFKLKKGEEIKIESICSDNLITIKTYDFKSFYFSVFCSLCNTPHIYHYSLPEIMRNRLTKFKCELTNLTLLFIGDKEEVQDIVRESNKKIDDIMKKCGFDIHIKNPHIIMKTLDKIHEIAEKGNLYCDCGCKDIDVSVFADRIELKCMKCGSLNIIYAENNQDYNNIAYRSIITLHEKSFTCLDSIYYNYT